MIINLLMCGCRSDWNRPVSRTRRHGGDRRDRSGLDRVQHRRQPQLMDHNKDQSEERRVVYVGGIDEGTLKSDLRTRFEAFGPIVDISVHFRERGDNYGFLTFQKSDDAFQAIERGNEDKSLAAYDLCFGGRRTFCREEYFDMDDVEVDEGSVNPGFDELLRKARKEIRK